MKTGQITPGTLDPSIVTCDSLLRLAAECSMMIISDYCYHLVDRDLTFQEQYIDRLFHIINFLYKYNYFVQHKTSHNQDLEVLYLSHLDHAVVRLKALMPEDANREMLATYLEKAALIFQTAADKTCREPEHDRNFYQEVWQAKTREYLEEAWKLRGQLFPIGYDKEINYNERIRDLYQSFAAIESILNHDLLLERYQEYQKKCTSGDTATPTAPNADSPSFFSAGLRHRHPQETASAGNTEETAPLLSETKILTAT